MKAYQIEITCEAFNAAYEQFELVVGKLQGQESARMEHGQIEALINKDGMELLRLLLQAHLDLRASREVREQELRGADGQIRTYGRNDCGRSLMSLFGVVRVRRIRYSAPGLESLFPLDAELNLPKDRYSHGLRYRVAREVACNSFDEAVSDIEATSGGRVPKRQAEDIAVAVSQDFEAFYNNNKEPVKAKDLLVMTTDGKGVVMRKEDLRPATRKAAEKSPPLPGARLLPGEKPNRKRMATVAAVYDLEARERSPEQIMGSEDEKKTLPHRPRAKNKRVWASIEEDSRAVIGSIFEEALRRDPEKKRHWAILVDGAEKQLEYILSFIEHYRIDVSLILDFIHVLEYLWKAAYGLHAVGSKEAHGWVAEQALEILRGKAMRVSEAMQERASCLSADQRKPVDKCADYLKKYAPLMDYDLYLKEGLPIATGVIEGACRHLIKDRLDRTGARWRLKGAEAVLKIRSLRSSGDFEPYWKFHQEREKERNHSCRYASPPTKNTAEGQSASCNQRCFEDLKEAA